MSGTNNRQPYSRQRTQTKLIVRHSGAGPSVIDLGTLQQLGLESRTRSRPTNIFVLGREPVHVVGNISPTIDVGDNQKL